MSSDAKTVPMNLEIQPNEASEFPTYEWQLHAEAWADLKRAVEGLR